MIKGEDSLILFSCFAREQKDLDITVETWVTQVNTKLGVCCMFDREKTLVLPSKIEMLILAWFTEQHHDYGC